LHFFICFTEDHELQTKVFGSYKLYEKNKKLLKCLFLLNQHPDGFSIFDN